MVVQIPETFLQEPVKPHIAERIQQALSLLPVEHRNLLQQLYFNGFHEERSLELLARQKGVSYEVIKDLHTEALRLLRRARGARV